MGAQGSVLRITVFFFFFFFFFFLSEGPNVRGGGGGYLLKSVPHYRVAMEEFVHPQKRLRALGSGFRV